MTLDEISSPDSHVSMVGSYNFTQKDCLFLDTNVWLSVFFRQKPLSKDEKFYSEIFSRILKANCRVYLDTIIVSEFINVSTKKKHRLVSERIKKLKKEGKCKSSSTMKRIKKLIKFKNFRKHKCFKIVASEIAMDVKRMLRHCTLINHNFSEEQIHTMVSSYSKGDIDFNDMCIANLCINNGWTLITDDADFRGKNIHILTANEKLLIS